MQEPTEVDIPVRPHVKAYIENNYFLKPSQQFKYIDPLWPVFKDCIAGKRTRWNYVASDKKNVITVNLGFNYNYHHRIIVTKDQEEKFNDFVERLMIHEFLKTAAALVKHTKLKKSKIISDFLQQYSYEEKKMSFEKLKKAFYRYEIKLKKRVPAKRAA